MSRLPALCSIVLVSTIALPPVVASDWTFAMGIHDMIVPDADSDTFGINATAYFDHLTEGGTHYTGAFDLFLDHDVDDLDPDHIPVWWKLNFQARNGLSKMGTNLNLDWLVDINTKVNTVSCVERQIKIMPGLIAEYENGSFRTSVKGLFGFYFLEIDDDVPKERGYTRDDYRNPTNAFSLAGDMSFALGGSSRIYLAAQVWHDGDTWLDRLYTASLRYATDHWRAGSELIFSIELNEYNLDLYYPSALGNPPTVPYLPILPWNEDILLRISFHSSW